jgi:hypothetical protein
MAYRRLPLDHPEFPHGTPRGYGNGCRKESPCPATPTCTQAQRAARAAQRTVNPSDPLVDVTHLRPAIRRWLREGWSEETIARAVGIRRRVIIVRIANGTQQRSRASTVAALRCLTVEKLRTVSTCVPADLVRWKLGSLVANGHSGASLARALFSAPAYINRFLAGESETVTCQLADAIDDLWLRLEGVPGPSTRSRNHARRLGFHPPDAYAMDGTLLPPDDSGDEDAADQEIRRQANAERRLRALWLCLRHRTPSGVVAMEVGLNESQVIRWRKGVGVRVHSEESFTPGVDHWAMPRPECAARARAVVDFLRSWREDPLPDHYAYSRALTARVREWDAAEKALAA